MARESALFLWRRSLSAERLPSTLFKLPSELGVRIPERGRDASGSCRAEEDIGGKDKSFVSGHYKRDTVEMMRTME